jgi:hypothetical protein
MAEAQKAVTQALDLAEVGWKQFFMDWLLFFASFFLDR